MIDRHHLIEINVYIYMNTSTHCRSPTFTMVNLKHTHIQQRIYMGQSKPQEMIPYECNKERVRV